MTLQTSGPISLLDVQNEFGGTNPISISEYYGVDDGVPTSGIISLYDFYGKSASWFTVNVAGYDVNVVSSPQNNTGGFWNTYVNSYTGPDVFPPAGTYSGTLYVDPENPNPNTAVDLAIRSTVSGTFAYAANNSSTAVLAVNFTLTMTGSGSSAGFDVLSRRKAWDTDPFAIGGANTAVNRVILDGVQIFYHSYYVDLYTTTVVVEILSIAGGGSGGSASDEYAGGGGGSGGLIIQSSTLALATSYSVVVGAGGGGGSNGSNSSFGGLTAAVGGGLGGNDTAKGLPHNGSSGGSGGGGGNNNYSTNTTGGAGTSGQGNAGGASTGMNAGGGGGGGYSSVGSNNGGSGGSGYDLQTFRGGSSTLVAGGGGGGPSGAGQAGGGTSGSSGVVNTGGGGGGGDGSGGGNGGSGIVIIRYLGTSARATGGTITYVTIGSNNYVVHTFTASGTFTTN